ncbi:glycosyltransferase family 2 protein [Brevibacillus sp. DP1.3A]|uniref:glycosyltransferase family 2 protein n=1 Tax=Brevibacillus sp. DP1.3A TaxID=2738867 RepID=UPI00156AE077|nr:glycosyltransferase family 2 protein [Brevibacillus sp. DP1.3A]UED76414.1 glycosyltransferase [Brevibacillus sp. DP1.3A]
MAKQRIEGLVSVVITNFNRAAYIRECLNSILQQTYENWEMILIDDASTDQSVEVAREWLEQNERYFPEDNQVLIHALPRNVGFAGAINIGHYMSRGEFIANQDSDDFSHVLRLSRQVEYLKSHPQIDLVGTNYYAFSSDHPEQKELATWIRYGDDIRKVYGSGGHCVCHGTCMFWGRLFDQVGGPTRRIDGAEDYEFIAKALNARAGVNNIEEALYYYRIHAEQRSAQYYRKKGV